MSTTAELYAEEFKKRYPREAPDRQKWDAFLKEGPPSDPSKIASWRLDISMRMLRYDRKQYGPNGE